MATLIQKKKRGELAALLREVAGNTKSFGDVLKTVREKQDAEGVLNTKMRTDVDGAVKRIEFLEQQNKQRSISLPGSREATYKGQGFSYVRAIRYLATGEEKCAETGIDCSLEAEVIKQTRKQNSGGGMVKRDMTSGNTGALVPQEIAGELIENLRAEVVLAQAGATLLTGLVGSPYPIPKKTGSTTGYWVGETEAPTKSDVTIGQLNMTPKTAAAMTQLSERLIMQANPGAEEIVRKDLLETLGIMIDTAGIRGTGASGEPLGLVNWPGVGSYPLGTNGGPITYEVLVNIVATARNSNALRNAKKLGWLFPPQILTQIELMRDGNGRPMLLTSEASMAQFPGSVGKLLGFPVYTTTSMPTNLTKAAGTSLGEVIFGDISTMAIGTWGGLELRVSKEAQSSFEKRMLLVLLFQELDVVVRQPERLVVSTDVETV